MNNEKEIRLQLEKWRGYSAYEIAVKNGYIGTEEEWAESLKNNAGKATVNGIAQDENYNIKVYLKDIPMRDSTTRNAQEEMDLKFDSGDLVQEPETGGKGWPLSAEAGKAIYEVAKARAKVLTQKVTLRLDGWTSEDDEYVQSAEVEGVVADADKASLIITPGEGREMEALYVDHEVRAKEQGDGVVKFSCTSKPAAHVEVNVMVVLLGQELYEVPGTGDGSGGGSGADGFSPTVTVERVGTATILTIVDVNGKKVATIEDGKTGAAGPAGANGKDGFSPVVEMTKDGDTANITITDVNGSKTVMVRDGKDGEAGPAGADGKDAVSPTVTAEKNGTVTTLTITDVNGTRTTKINDGADGQDGQDGPAGADGFSPRVTMSKRNGTATVSIIDAAGPHSVELYDGEQGPQGPAGTDGKDGVSPTVTVQKNGKIATITVVDAENIEKQVSIYDGADGKAGDTGPQGPAGEAGFTPIVSLTKEGKATTLMITDKENSHVAVIYDGNDGLEGATGQPGKDGVSPKVELSKSGKVNTLKVTDAEGEKRTTINDGEDGVSPTIETRKSGKITTLTITDANGIRTVQINDGADGSGGSGASNIVNGAGIGSARGVVTKEEYDHSMGYGSFAMGSGTQASGDQSAAFGNGTTASGDNTFAKGRNTTASGDNSNAEGEETAASGRAAHTEGLGTVASGTGAHAEGYKTIAKGNYQHVEGMFNAEDTEDRYVHIVGGGYADYARSNLHTLDKYGNAWFKGKVYVGGTSMDDAAELGTGGGTGGSLPTGGEPHQMLVTDAEGNTVWEDRTHYKAFVTETHLPETTLTAAEGGTAMVVGDPLSVAIGADCTVTWNGTAYQCTAKEYEESGVTMPVLGNLAAFGGEDTGEPFSILIVPGELQEAMGGASAGVFPLDGSTSVTLSIVGEGWASKTLEYDYMPAGYPTVETVTGVILPETEIVLVGAIVGTNEPLAGDIIVGKTYTVGLDGVDYQTTAKKMLFEGEETAFLVTVLGNLSIGDSGEDTGEPFLIVVATPEIQELYGDATLLVSGISIDGNSHNLYIVGEMEKVTEMDARFVKTAIADATKNSLAFSHSDAFPVRANTVPLVVDVDEEGKPRIIAVEAVYLGDHMFGDTAATGNIVVRKGSGEWEGTLSPHGVFSSDDGHENVNGLILKSSTSGSTKYFKITVDDSGVVASTDADDSTSHKTSVMTPAVTTADNGKFLRVVDGAWAAVALPNAEEATF